MPGKRTFGGALLALLLLTAACGGDDDEASDDATTDEDAPDTTEPAGDGAASDDPYAPQPLDERGELTFSLSGNFEFVFPVQLAVEMGEFDKENLDVEIITISATEQLADLAGGQADIAGIGAAAAAMNAVDQGIELQFFQNTHDAPSPGTSEGLWVDKDKLTDDGELDPDQVDGLRIVLGTQKEASPTVYVLKTALDAVDKEVGDVEVMGLNPNADSLVALQNGAVDGAHLLSPFSDDPGLAECCALVQETIPAGKYAAMKEDLEGDPELYEAFVRALVRTQRTYLQGNYHQDPEVAPILAEFTGAPQETVEAAATWYGFGDEARNDEEMVEELQDMWLGFGEILSYDEAHPVEDFSTQAVVEAVNAG
ncbi:MAG TPA: hypothetical protein VK611_29380 [Acidimicrobiales bacterium]|nr:hypothetical protein [Acidimicrobiales bacterium]